MKFIAPEFKKEGFHCPLCGTYSHMNWIRLRLENKGTNSDYFEALCSHCNKSSMWRVTKSFLTKLGERANEAEMLFPDHGFAALPEEDMPEDVKSDYLEAARIFNKSPRGSAALLRLSLQKLCIHLGEDGKNINKDIRSLAAKNILPPLVINVADTVRLTGNNAVHPGQMSDEDVDMVSAKMFDLINFIVRKGISEPLELQKLYEMTPENARKNAEATDAKAKLSNE